MRLTLLELASMCGGTLSANSNPDLIIQQVVIDSRLICPNTLFVALVGERHDAHQYVAGSCKDTNTAALVNINSGLKLANLIYVEDTVKALGKLASNYRKKFTLPVVAITGSNGKTTVKEMLKSICIAEFGATHVLATPGNLNNHLGMPLTLLQLNPAHKVAIIEMGMNHPGELSYLSQLAQPNLAVVNNVMWAHAGFFNSLTEIAQAKGEIYSGLTLGGLACINLAEPLHAVWQASLPQHEITQFSYGTPGSSCYLAKVKDDGSIIISTNQGNLQTKLQVLGKHNCYNAVTAAALAVNLNCSLEAISQGLANYAGYKGRLQRKTAFNGALIIDDSYNANPDSVKAAIIAIQNLPKPHWFIFADLKELGKFSAKFHQEIGQFAANNGIDMLLTVGEMAAITNTSFNGKKLHFSSNQDIVEYCLHYLPVTATLLIKGSNSMGLGTLVEQLTASIR